jgi:hypothetical protein
LRALGQGLPVGLPAGAYDPHRVAPLLPNSGFAS